MINGLTYRGIIVRKGAHVQGYEPVEYDPLGFLSRCPPERNEKFPAQSTKVINTAGSKHGEVNASHVSK